MLLLYLKVELLRLAMHVSSDAVCHQLKFLTVAFRLARSVLMVVASFVMLELVRKANWRAWAFFLFEAVTFRTFLFQIIAKSTPYCISFWVLNAHIFPGFPDGSLWLPSSYEVLDLLAGLHHLCRLVSTCAFERISCFSLTKRWSLVMANSFDGVRECTTYGA